MARLLINIPVEASTHKYAAMVPHPMLLLNIKKEDDVLIDLVLKTYRQNVGYKMIVLDNLIKQINRGEMDKYETIIVNCGEYAPDGYYSKWIEYFLNRINKSVQLMGPYATIFKSRIRVIEKRTKIDHTILDTDYNTYNVVIPDDLLLSFPKIATKHKATMRITLGCPRYCAMCPVQLIHNHAYTFFDIDKSIDKIKLYYLKGIRYINFIDDNISANIPMLIVFLKKLKDANLKSMDYGVQEGFELSSLYDEEVCKALKDVNFKEIKIGVENIKEDFLVKINKEKRSIEQIKQAVDNVKKYKLNAKFFFLISDFQSKQDILDNLKFFSQLGVDLRVNIIRQYEGMLLKSEEKKITPQELRHLKALGYATAYMTTTQKFDIFQENALEKYCKEKGYQLKESGENTFSLEGGKQYFGFKTVKWIKALEFMLNEAHPGFSYGIDYNPILKQVETIYYERNQDRSKTRS